MEEILLAVLGGAAVVVLANKSTIVRNATKSVIKAGYGVAAMVTEGGSSAVETVKDLMAESKAEFEASKAAKAEVTSEE
jgi:hypothetical protein